ncbi:hypothetical protein ACFPN0_30515 [Kitasatospora cinereorecta]
MVTPREGLALRLTDVSTVLPGRAGPPGVTTHDGPWTTGGLTHPAAVIEPGPAPRPPGLPGRPRPHPLRCLKRSAAREVCRALTGTAIEPSPRTSPTPAARRPQEHLSEEFSWRTG